MASSRCSKHSTTTLVDIIDNFGVQSNRIFCIETSVPSINANNFADTIHVVEPTYNFSNYGVKAWTKTSAGHNACIHFTRSKVHLLPWASPAKMYSSWAILAN
uniref:Uncharacterized protein n=1 Tax=Opuntia streptacantha TaxID=393608 RepID=A0A7C9DBI8_OPUST